MEKFSIYDILAANKAIREADEEQVTQQQVDDISGGIDDDFSIDTSLDDGGSPENDLAAAQDNNPEAPAEPGDGEEGMDDMGGTPGDAPNPDAEEGEEVPANTDIFSSLTAEEQQIKIKELKKLYASLYSSCDDILARINKLDINEDNLETVSRVSTSIYDMKIYLSDYLTLVFPTKSYIENDVTFVRFLTIIKSITEILEELVKKYNKEVKEKEES